MNINDPRLKLTLPIEDIEEGALAQIESALELPYLKTLAIMPDVHAGYDLPIGGVALLEDHIWPGAVGYDIGCGMCFQASHILADELPDHKEIYKRILGMIPVGFDRQKSKMDFAKFRSASGYACLDYAVNEHATQQMGTLGGGNHFIEIGVSTMFEGHSPVGVTIHSGSRRAGWLIGDFYMRTTNGPVPLNSEIGQAYLQDMNWALDFALANRKHMMQRVFEALGDNFSDKQGFVNENHNHAVVTPEGVLHRKGATPAEYGQIGIIPANMRDGVYITVGLGNTEFLSSASHGAGRTMSRTKASKNLSFSDFQNDMCGIVCPIEEKREKLLDEAPGAYKNINQVLEYQKGKLINVVDHYSPIIVVKG